MKSGDKVKIKSDANKLHHFIPLGTELMVKLVNNDGVFLVHNEGANLWIDKDEAEVIP